MTGVQTCALPICLVLKLRKGLLKEKYPDREVHLIPIHTPSFVGSMISGYDEAVKDIIEYFATPEKHVNGKINLFTGWVNPADVTELKSLMKEMDIEANVLFEIESFDAPIMPDGNHVAHGETTIEDLKSTANALGTIALNRYECFSAAQYLEDEHGVPAIIGNTPIGIRNTDAFLSHLKKITGKSIPQSLVKKRGIALDAIADVSHMFLAGKKVAIFGNPDLVIGLAEFCIDLEMEPVLLLLGDDTKTYSEDPRIQRMIKEVPFPMEIVTNADLWELEDRIRNKGLKLDLILGHSKGRYVAIDNNIPMVRVGFPVYDRAGSYRHPVVGYAGAIRLAEDMANAIFSDMEYKHNKEWVLNVW